MSDCLDPFVHGRATPLLKEGFVANTQEHTSHSLGPNCPIEALDESVPISEFLRVWASTPRERERERERERVERDLRERIRIPVVECGKSSHPYHEVEEFTGYQP